MHWVTYKRHLLLQMTAGRNECNGKQSGWVFALSPQQTRTVSSQILRPCRTFLLASDGASATTSDDPGPSPQHSDMDLNLDVSLSLTDSNADAEGVTDDEVLAPSPTRSAPHPLLRSSCRHEHPDGPMLGFVVPEREVADANASTSLDQARASPDRGFDFDLTSLTSLNPNVSDGEGWVDWPTQHDLGGTSISPDAGVGVYAGDGTIDCSRRSGAVSTPVYGYSNSPASCRANLIRKKHPC